MRRREFITGIAAASCGPASSQPSVPVVGFLSAGLQSTNRDTFDAFSRGLLQEGFKAGYNLALDVVWGVRDRTNLQGAAANMIRKGVRVIAASGGNEAVYAAMSVSRSTPIVFATGADPIAAGLVSKVASPDGLVTGATFYSELESKILDLMVRYFPKTGRIWTLHRQDDRALSRVRRLTTEVAQRGLEFHAVPVDLASDVLDVARKINAREFDAFLPISDALFNSVRVELAEVCRAKRMLFFAYTAEQAEAGALLTYGASRPEVFHRVGSYVGRLLRGASISDLPVMFSERHELSLNVTTAKMLGVELVSELLAISEHIYE